MLNRSGQKILSCMVAIVLILSVGISGCSSAGNEDIQATKRGSQDSEAIVAKLKEKYENNQTVDYVEGEAAIARDYQFLISYDFDPIEAGMDDYTQIASLYYDAELTQPVGSTYDWASEDKKSYTISPWEYPSAAMQTIDPDSFPYGTTDNSPRLFNKGAYADWGNIGTMYLATKVDLNTGETLKKPSVQVITVKGELDTPRLSLEITDEGLVQFSWDEVRDAKAYYIVQCSVDKEGKILSATPIGQTSETKWSNELVKEKVSDTTFAINETFKTYLISEDDWLSQSIIDSFGKTYNPMDGAVDEENSSERLYCVVAVNEKGTSMYSQTVHAKDIAALAPYTLAYNMDRLSDEGFSGYVKGVTMMPSHRWIVMCDGSLSQRLVNYDFDAATLETETWYNDTDSGAFEAESVDVIKVPYIVEGTAFSGTLVISEYNKKTWEEQLKTVELRQEALRNKTGDVKREIILEEDEAAKSEESNEATESTDEKAETEIVAEDVVVTAHSALSEYLALNMLNGNQKVDLSDFPEALDQSYLVDAWSEAFYQNPLVLGVSGAEVSRDGKTLYLVYEDDQASRETKKAAIIEKADQVVSKIITDSMTAREKEFAINQYLCDTVTYDDAALMNAEKYDYLKVDSEFYDSFTAYGALIDGVGVCASYSAAFKVLADAAELNSVVVTGYLDGTLGHAWNRVDLGDEQWATVDSTNNDIEIISNALLNAPDSAVASTLVEDDLWVMNSVLTQYQNESDEDEFYHVEGLFFDQDNVVDQIVAQLSSKSVAVVRTDYLLTDAQFYEIGGAVSIATENPNLSGCYWMGVIVIASDDSLLM